MQSKLGWPGLVSEVEKMCKEVGLRSLNEDAGITKQEIKEAIFYSNYKEMKSAIAKYDKLEAIKHENLTKEQEYMKEKVRESKNSMYTRYELRWRKG